MEVSVNRLKYSVGVDGNMGFWDQVNRGTWEPETFRILSAVLKKDRSYVDVGAWIGPTCLYGCQLARFCYAIEPDPVAFRVLQDNIRFSGFENIVADELAIFDSVGKINIASPNTSLGDSCVSYLFDNISNVLVPSITLGGFFEKWKITDCNFIKMDTEGAEYVILPQAREVLKSVRPALLLALHSNHFKDREEYFSTIVASLSDIYSKIYFSGFVERKLQDIPELTGWDNVLLIPGGWV